MADAYPLPERERLKGRAGSNPALSFNGGMFAYANMPSMIPDLERRIEAARLQYDLEHLGKEKREDGMRGKVICHRDGTCDYLIEGRSATKEEFDAAFPPQPDFLDVPPMSSSASAWPMYSDAMGVHPKQIEEARARNRAHGIQIDYLPDGRAILTDRGSRRDLMRIEGYHDNNGGYGDDHA